MLNLMSFVLQHVLELTDLLLPLHLKRHSALESRIRQYGREKRKSASKSRLCCVIFVDLKEFISHKTR